MLKFKNTIKSYFCLFQIIENVLIDVPTPSREREREREKMVFKSLQRINICK